MIYASIVTSEPTSAAKYSSWDKTLVATVVVGSGALVVVSVIVSGAFVVVSPPLLQLARSATPAIAEIANNFFNFIFIFSFFNVI